MTHVASDATEVRKSATFEEAEVDEEFAVVAANETESRDDVTAQADVLFDAADLDVLLSDCDEFEDDEILRDLREKRRDLVAKLRLVDERLRTARQLES